MQYSVPSSLIVLALKPFKTSLPVSVASQLHHPLGVLFLAALLVVVRKHQEFEVFFAMICIQNIEETHRLPPFNSSF